MTLEAAHFPLQGVYGNLVLDFGVFHLRDVFHAVFDEIRDRGVGELTISSPPPPADYDSKPHPLFIRGEVAISGSSGLCVGIPWAPPQTPEFVAFVPPAEG